MVTTEEFNKLKTLQEILKEKYDLQKKVEDAPRQLSGQKELLNRYKKDYIAKNEEYEIIREKVLKLKFELEEAVKSREEGEKGMDNINTHREYEALEKQISEATAREEELRKELQKEEKNKEETEEDLKMLEDDVKTAEETVASSEESLNSELDSYNNKLAELQAAEEENSRDIDQEILFKFQRIIQRNSEGIVAVRGSVCSGCHMILPAQFANSVHSGDEIKFCPYCSRILFYEESDDSQTDDFSSLEYAGSLAGLDDDFDDEDEFDEDEREDGDEDEDRYDDSDSLEDRGDDDEEDDDDSDQDSDED